MSEPATVRAAGGLVTRRRPDGVTEVLLVHRPAYDDWSFPKGKARPGERDEEAARREVEEETGYRCRLGDELGEVRYHDSAGRPKVVRYWRMEPLVDTGRGPDHEVDEVGWFPADDAARMLTYRHDRALLGTIEDDR
ncbi:MAG: NUDIX domain-containing protein [Acidimicrobiia bacterium]|nr:NUDIX domain-containing protein [Acidimicrobiia bacterium]